MLVVGELKHQLHADEGEDHREPVDMTYEGARGAGHPAPHRAVVEGQIKTSNEARGPDPAQAKSSRRQERAG
jgi:hypothetical protein